MYVRVCVCFVISFHYSAYVHIICSGRAKITRVLFPPISQPKRIIRSMQSHLWDVQWHYWVPSRKLHSIQSTRSFTQNTHNFFSESVNNTRYDFLFTLFNCDFCGICRLLCVFVWCAFAPLEVSDDRFWTKSANGLRKLCHIFAIVILTFETRAKSLYPFLLKLLVVVPRNTWKKTNRTQMCKMT